MANNISNNEVNGILTEYNNLRQEIRDRQNSRFTILAFVVVAVGAIHGVAYSMNLSIEKPRLSEIGLIYPWLAALFSIILLTCGLLLTRDHSLMCGLLASYIREYLEAKGCGLNWETCLNKYRNTIMPARFGLSTSFWKFRTSNHIAISYSLLAFFVLIIFAYSVLLQPGSIVVKVPLGISIIGFFLWASDIAYDLFFMKGKDWKFQWQVVLDNEKTGCQNKI